MILRGGRVTMADITAVQQFKVNLKRGIEVLKFKANGVYSSTADVPLTVSRTKRSTTAVHR